MGGWDELDSPKDSSDAAQDSGQQVGKDAECGRTRPIGERPNGFKPATGR